MSDHVHTQKIPRAALLGAAVLIVATVGLAAQSRAARLATPVAVNAPPLESTEVRFADQKDGSIAVLDASSGRPISTVAPGTNGFIRGVLRGMFRTRKLEAMGHDGTFVLARESNGRLTLVDPQTQRRVDIDSFGPTNAATFDAILVASRASRASRASAVTAATP